MTIPLEEAINYLETFKSAIPPAFWQIEGNNTKMGFDIALKILRRLSKTDTDSLDHKLLLAFANYAVQHKDYAYVYIRRCSCCDKPHGETHMVKLDVDPAKLDEVEMIYFGLCPSKIAPMYYFPDDVASIEEKG